MGTSNLGCGNAFSGGRCTDGSDPTNCIYDSVTERGMEKCAGNLELVKIPRKYECSNQRGKLKCIKSRFQSSDECYRDCPGYCRENVCSLKD